MSLLNRCTNLMTRSSVIQRCAAFYCTDGGKPATKKKPVEVRINVIENTSLTVMSKDSALKLANRRGLTLVPVENPAVWMQAGNRPPFELIPLSLKVGAAKDDSVKAAGFKGQKNAVFTAKIADHDLRNKVNQIKKWIASGFVVDVGGEQSERMQDILKVVEEELKGQVKLPGAIKKNNKSTIRIRYEPLRTPTQSKEDTGIDKGSE